MLGIICGIEFIILIILQNILLKGVLISVPMHGFSLNFAYEKLIIYNLWKYIYRNR